MKQVVNGAYLDSLKGCEICHSEFLITTGTTLRLPSSKHNSVLTDKLHTTVSESDLLFK